jgi:hypothetical protein
MGQYTEIVLGDRLLDPTGDKESWIPKYQRLFRKRV